MQKSRSSSTDPHITQSLISCSQMLVHRASCTLAGSSAVFFAQISPYPTAIMVAVIKWNEAMYLIVILSRNITASKRRALRYQTKLINIVHPEMFGDIARTDASTISHGISDAHAFGLSPHSTMPGFLRNRASEEVKMLGHLHEAGRPLVGRYAVKTSSMPVCMACANRSVEFTP